ncbi:MAG TPA: glycosyltransferase [Methylomusa anaerophila]|uniref:Putative glycosyltransferase EpsJ n=1 Tax=Methylomusa anaerophila TaxID=1930071 RepID=A0A348AGC1_9FIRM|nr:glycosyltransferase [Methylomusa anaerophila]BBB90119.1 putative glycosyltransferase EpsJ [Methylomusa anaerophila]HML88157.1 glycosyltransferase [Methylomusa anaerophila]
MKMPLLSIIIPIYKVEKYLNECIDSVLKQSFTDYEIILVDDGSPDNCGKICDHYAQTDKKIKVIHKENSGVSETRNIGIDNSCGQYLMFLDGDDFLVDGCLELMKDTIISNEKTDIFIGQSMIVYDDDKKHFFLQDSFDAEAINKLQKKEILVYIFGTVKDIVWAVWRNVYRRELVISNGLYFDKKLICAEDGDWHIKAMLAAEKISAFKLPLVNYRRRFGSALLSKSNQRKVMSELQVYKKWFDYFNTCDFEEKYKKVITGRFANLFINQFGVIDFENKAEKKDVVNFIAHNSYILNSSHIRGTKHKASVLVCQLLGINLGIWCLTRLRIARNKITNRRWG